MNHFHFSSIEGKEITDHDSKQATIRRFMTKKEAPNFIMRRFDIGPGGRIGIHSHPHEHEIYILSGELVLLHENNLETFVNQDEFVFIPAEEPHGYENRAKVPASFICVIPK